MRFYSNKFENGSSANKFFFRSIGPFKCLFVPLKALAPKMPFPRLCTCRDFALLVLQPFPVARAPVGCTTPAHFNLQITFLVKLLGVQLTAGWSAVSAIPQAKLLQPASSFAVAYRTVGPIKTRTTKNASIFSVSVLSKICRSSLNHLQRK